MTTAARPRYAPLAPSVRPVVIDTDPGIDDALALMLAMRSPEIRVTLLTTVAGNVPVSTATANAARLLAVLRPLPWPELVQGAARPLRRTLQTATAFHGDDGLGGLSTLRDATGQVRYPVPASFSVGRRAVSCLLETVQHYGRDLTLIALGPLTNVARAIQRAPETMQRLGQIVIMGGALRVPGNISPTAEFNIFVDPQAADIVLRSGIPLILVPLDVTQRVRLTHTWLCQQSQDNAQVLTQVLQEMLTPALRRHADGIALHDPLAVAVALDAACVRLTTLPLWVETRGQHTLGMTVADQRPPAAWLEDAPRIQVAMEVDAPRVLDLFARRVLAP